MRTTSSRMNREWHMANRMPPNATEEQRIAWHTAHARACGCRKIEGGVAELFRKRSLPIPVFGEPDGQEQAEGASQTAEPDR